jgi:hypothetical protein
VRSPLHARGDHCPAWCVGRVGQPHDRDDLYGVLGTHHDSEIVSVVLEGGGTVDVRASLFVPDDGEPWPARVEVDAELPETRRWSGPDSTWLSPDEALTVCSALRKAAAIVGLREGR